MYESSPGSVAAETGSHQEVVGSAQSRRAAYFCEAYHQKLFKVFSYRPQHGLFLSLLLSG